MSRSDSTGIAENEAFRETKARGGGPPSVPSAPPGGAPRGGGGALFKQYKPDQGKVTRVSTVCTKPNGILLTPDCKTLYLADNRDKLIYKYDVAAPGKLVNQTRWIDLGAGPDGMTLDTHGNLYVSCGRAGVKVYSPRGKPIGVIKVPYASNCVFGGPDFTTLYVTSADKFLGLKTKVRGIKPPCLQKQ